MGSVVPIRCTPKPYYVWVLGFRVLGFRGLGVTPKPYLSIIGPLKDALVGTFWNPGQASSDMDFTDQVDAERRGFIASAGAQLDTIGAYRICRNTI